MPDERQEDRVIAQLCAVWSELDGHPAVVQCHPDREGVSGGCDAIVLRKDQHLAVEHTSVHTTPQRPGHLRHLESFRKLLVPQLHEALPDEVLQVAIPIKLIQGFASPETTARQIVSAVVLTVPSIPQCRGLIIDDAPGLRFRVFVHRFLPSRTKRGEVFLTAYGPDDEDVGKDMLRALRDKWKKLRRCQREGFRTVLILDAPESGPMSGYFWQVFVDAAAKADLSPFDEVILASSWAGPAWFTPLCGDGRVFQTADDFSDFWDAQIRVIKSNNTT